MSRLVPTRSRFATPPSLNSGHPKVPVVIKRTKNFGGASANKQLAISALRSGLCLQFQYDGFERVVEVHTVGITSTGRWAMSAFQVDGQSRSNIIPDWRLFCFDECFDARLTNNPSAAPRFGYVKGAKQFRKIEAEI